MIAQQQMRIDRYFKDPEVRSALEKDLGELGKVSIDLHKKTVTAVGKISKRVWNLDEMNLCLASLERFAAERPQQ